MRRKIPFFEFMILIVALGSLTVVWTLADCDIRIQRFFYTPDGRWTDCCSWLWSLLYEYGTFPAILISAISLCVFLLSFQICRLSAFRKKALFFLLLMLIGPGVMVNFVLKDHWGRPRPRDVDVFGGDQRYLTVFEKGTAGKGKSFPSGHASMGFYLMAPYFTLRASFPRRAKLFLLLGTSYGLLMGIGRMAQGGHFASDVIWAGGIVYLCGLTLCHLFGLDREVIDAPRDAPHGIP